MGVNILAFIYSCISRPYKDSLINAHTIFNDAAVIAVTGAFYPMRDVYQRDESLFQRHPSIFRRQPYPPCSRLASPKAGSVHQASPGHDASIRQFLQAKTQAA